MINIEFDHAKDILLYFISTVPQTLGAMLAILGAFQLYVRNDLRDRLLGQTQIVFDYMSDDNKLNQIYSDLQGDLKEKEVLKKLKKCRTNIQEAQISKQVERIETVINDLNEYLKSNRREGNGRAQNINIKTEACKDHIEFIYKQKILFIRLVKVNAVIIVFFLLSFYFVPWILNNSFAFNSFLITGILSAVYGLYRIIRFIINSTNSEKNTNP